MAILKGFPPSNTISPGKHGWDAAVDWTCTVNAPEEPEPTVDNFWLSKRQERIKDGWLHHDSQYSIAELNRKLMTKRLRKP